jgi:hypothetical protein
MTTKTKAHNRCTSTNQCPGMQAAMDGAGERQIGFHTTLLLSMAKGETEARLAYRFPKKVNGSSVILVNFCPWCGEKVAP